MYFATLVSYQWMNEVTTIANSWNAITLLPSRPGSPYHEHHDIETSPWHHRTTHVRVKWAHGTAACHSTSVASSQATFQLHHQRGWHWQSQRCQLIACRAASLNMSHSLAPSTVQTQHFIAQLSSLSRPVISHDKLKWMARFCYAWQEYFSLGLFYAAICIF